MMNHFVTPKKGTPILYICMKCGKSFTVKKRLINKPVKCPDCKDGICISPLKYNKNVFA